MSITNVPTYPIPDHGDPLSTIMGSNTLSNLIDQMAEDNPEIWDAARESMEEECDNFLDVMDEYIQEAPEEMFDSTSVYTGNTRGAIKVYGNYPDVSIEFDEDEWRRPKVLTNLTVRVIHSEWETKAGIKKSKTYTYAPGSLKVKITGEDYAPRIPEPPHGGGNVEMLKAVYEEIRDSVFNRIAKSRGLI